MGEITKVAKKHDLEPGTSFCVEAGGYKIALFNVEGTYYAIGDTCTHRGGLWIVSSPSQSSPRQAGPS